MLWNKMNDMDEHYEEYTDEQIAEWNDEDAMPWVNLSPEEIKDLRTKKHTLTQYGKQKLNEMMNRIPDNDEIEDIMNITLTKEKKAELDNMRLINRYNQYYNGACSGMPQGGPISTEHLQSLALKSAIYAFARKYNMKESIPVEDLKNLADLLEKQGNEYLERVQEFKDSADGVA